MLRYKILISLLPVVVAGILGTLYYRKSHAPATAPAIVQESASPAYSIPEFSDGATAPVGTSATSPEAVLPETPESDTAPSDLIDDRIPSDEELLEAARALTGDPLLRIALSQESALKHLVQFTEAIANGSIPRGIAGLLGDFPRFAAAHGPAGYLAATAATLLRFAPAVNAVTAVSPEAAAAWLQKAEPRLDEILRSMGYSGEEASYRRLLTQALSCVLQIPLFNFEPELTESGVPGNYEYRDEVFRELNDAQKAFVRLGHANNAKVRAWTQKLSAELGLFR